MKLKVLPRGSAMVPNYETMRQRRQFRGWKHTTEIGETETLTHPVTGEAKEVKRDGFVKQDGQIVEVPCTVEYLRHLRDGDLWPADEETARVACVPFDSTFGNEHFLT